MPFYELKTVLAADVARTLDHPEVTAEAILADFTTPPNISLGHLALPCFKFAKTFRKGADKIAKDLATALTREGLTVTPAGPYANFRWDPRLLYTLTLERIFTEREKYGTDTLGRGKCIVLEYCSPNIAKKLAFQHIRSTLIGNTLANIYDALGFKTERINFVGDWGTQFARLLAAVDLWGDRDSFGTGDVPGSMAKLFELYVRFHKHVDNEPSYLEKANHALKLLEEGNPLATELWKTIREVSVKSMEATLSRMSIRFNHVEGESTYVPAIESTLADIKKKAGAKLSEGAWIVEVPDISTPALVQKRDGTTLYLTRDIAAAIDRYRRFQFDKMFYVVSEQQRLHFQLLFGVLKKMGHDWAARAEHISFGTVLFGAEKMSTREGRVIFLDDILEEAKKLALAECTAKNPTLVNKDEVAGMVGIGAIIFGELSSHRLRDIEFDWKHILALDGETGPYVQYAAVRCQSLLEKAEEKGESSSGEVTRVEGYELAAEEEALVLALSRFRAVLRDSIRENEPYHLTHFLIDLAKAFNRFYYRFPVLQATDAEQRRMRLNLVRGTRQTILNGLNLLGIPCPKEM